MKRESILVKGKTNVRAKADARVATTVARAKTPAKAKAVAPPTEASPKLANHEAWTPINRSQRLESLTPGQIGTGLLASAGVAGVVLGLAAKESLSMILAGLQIALTNPMKIEAVVIVDSEYGEIEEISLTYVVLKA
jgi:hypothetical protein